MITDSSITTQANKDWRLIMREAITDPAELFELLHLDNAMLAAAIAGAKRFPLKVSRPFVARMHSGDRHDPLLLQVLPDIAESKHKIASNYSADPLQEKNAITVPSLLHKYHDRALLLSTSVCASHCRYCFRRHFPYKENQLGQHHAAALQAIKNQKTLKEVILSGGDPWSLSDNKLQQLLTQLNDINHLHRLRIHTRLPIFAPSRITTTLLSMLQSSRLPVIVVIHCNHANEIDNEVRQALLKLHASGLTVLNQSVLLRHINDSPQALIDLSEALFSSKVLPYYLHIPDAVRDTEHYAVSRRRAQKLLGQAATRLPGYLVPRLVQEIPGKPAKQTLGYHLPNSPW